MRGSVLCLLCMLNNNGPVVNSSYSFHPSADYNAGSPAGGGLMHARHVGSVTGSQGLGSQQRPGVQFGGGLDGIGVAGAGAVNNNGGGGGGGQIPADEEAYSGQWPSA